jgi:ribose transport system substrate-binding protein
MKKIFFSLISCMVILFTFVTFAQETISVAGITQNTVDPFWVSVNCGAQEEAEKRGIDLQLFTSTNLDANELTALFDSTLLVKPDGLFLNVQNLQQFYTQLNQLTTDGVPVASNQQTDPATVHALIWTSADSSSFMDELLTLIPEGEGSIGVLGGVAGIVPLEMRYMPVVEGIAKANPGLKVLPTEYSFFDVNNATGIVDSWLIAHPDLKVIVASNGPDGVGAAAAIKNAGLAGKVALIAFDAVPPEVDGLRDGTITALIAQPAKAIGAAQLGALVDYLEAGNTGPVPVATELQGISQQLLTPGNIDNPENSDYIYVTECN